MKLVIGVEFHKSIDLEHKLFCDCIIKKSPLKKSFFKTFTNPLKERISEFKRKKTKFFYSPENVCCLELDEAPPFSFFKSLFFYNALLVAEKFKFSKAPFFEIKRKQILDGSLSSGFQRTCLLGTSGKIKLDNTTFVLEELRLEEDSSQKIEGGFNLDRQGLPLIEITTKPLRLKLTQVEPFLRNFNKELDEALFFLEHKLSIRQDLNLSFDTKKRIEIKGFQEIEETKNLLSYEKQRRANLKKTLHKLKWDSSKINLCPLKKKELVFLKQELIPLLNFFSISYTFEKECLYLELKKKKTYVKEYLKEFFFLKNSETRGYKDKETFFLRPIFDSSKKIYPETDCELKFWKKEKKGFNNFKKTFCEFKKQFLKKFLDRQNYLYLKKKKLLNFTEKILKLFPSEKSIPFLCNQNPSLILQYQDKILNVLNKNALKTVEDIKKYLAFLKKKKKEPFFLEDLTLFEKKRAEQKIFFSSEQDIYSFFNRFFPCFLLTSEIKTNIFKKYF